MTKSTKKAVVISTCICLAMIIAFGWVSVLTSGFTKWEPDPLKVNPENLYSTVELDLVDSNTGYGVLVDVDENGAIRFKGTASADLDYEVGTVILDKGTYTFTASDKTSNTTIYVTATAGGQEVTADFTPANTFEVAADDTAFKIVVHIAKGTTLNNVDILPCIYVAGDEVVDFYE